MTVKILYTEYKNRGVVKIKGLVVSGFDIGLSLETFNKIEKDKFTSDQVKNELCKLIMSGDIELWKSGAGTITIPLGESYRGAEVWK